MKEIKTNAMRLLDKAGVAYTPLYYDLGEEPFSGEAVCRALNASPESSFKTLCARGERTGVAVFVMPIPAELSLKAAAKALGDKKVEMVHVKDLLSLTGYQRGGVSPVGMKKRYPVFIHNSALEYDQIRISGGMKGVSLMVSPKALGDFLQARFENLTQEG